MSLSEDEQDDDNIFDQLKSIKAFTVDQLYLLHPDVGCPSTNSADDSVVDPTSGCAYHDQTLYQNLVEYEQLKHKLNNLASEVKHLNRKMFGYVDKVWIFIEKEPRKIGMCQQGKIAETTLKYKQAFIDEKQLNVLNLSFDELSEMISKDYIYYSFESQMKLQQIETQLSYSRRTPDRAERSVKLKSAIATLVDFMRHLGDSRSDFILQYRRWLRSLMKNFLEQETTEDYRFIISQLSRGPAGTADWSADLIACKYFDQITDFESVPQYITHCSTLLSELFNTLRNQLKKVILSNGDNLDPPASNECSDQNWSLIDPRFSCSEELRALSGNTLSESDVIKFCLKIPVAQIFKAYVRKCLEFDELRKETDKNYELIMLKLLTIGTIVIKTYQIGLETFNSIQYGSLIEYLSSQIRTTVIVLSDQWTEFKRRLKGVDNALMMRLQVEYDNFILRSILIILELRHSGIWRHLSRIEQDGPDMNEALNCWSTESIRPAFAKLLQATGITSTSTASSQTNNTEDLRHKDRSLSQKASSSLTYQFSTEWFKEVSEPMLWHILWQFYHNAFVSSCDYHSDNYWLEKFKEKSVIYLFVNKMRDSPAGECSYLLNSITSMLLSRTKKESKLVTFIATEICNLSFKHDQAMKNKITNKGVRALIKCAEKFPHLISLFINYMSDEDLSDDAVELIKGCSLSGWLCDDDELDTIARWLIELPLNSSRNKVARLLISKMLLNSPEYRTCISSQEDDDNCKQRQAKAKKTSKHPYCYVDLKTRRRLALLLYEMTVRHLPENNEFGPQSLATFVEVAFGDLCETNSNSHYNLLALAIDTSYQKVYVWVWRILFTLRLHILNQPETDWNDVQSRSGTSRSIKNTVLLNDLFHPVPSIQDSECLSLSEGLKNHNPVASFIYLLMTDVTWQTDTLDSCLNQLNMMSSSGHLTPSLMAMEFLTICHINDLNETVSKDRRCSEYFTTIISSNFDSRRLASLIVSQLQRLKQYRQLQLSQFYIKVLLEVASVQVKQHAASWFAGNEYNLEKVGSLLDHIVKFNFITQRQEIIRKFYDASYSIQDCKATSGWFGSMFSSNSLSAVSTRREFLTILHILTQKFKKFTWLRWVTTECDTLRLEKIWEDIVVYLSANEGANLESAIKKISPQINPSILKSTLPIYSWLKQIFDLVEADVNHPLCPLIWYNFFLNYFANSLNGVSVGLKLLPQETLIKLQTRLDSLFNYHLYKQRNWSSASTMQQNSLAKLYRAYRLWLQDTSLQDAYVDIDRLRDDYLVPLLKSVMESAEGACFQYIDLQNIETQNRNLVQVWSAATKLEGNETIKEMVFVDSNLDNSIEIITSVDDEASDAVSLILKSGQTLPENNESDDDLSERPIYDINEDKLQSAEEIILQVKRNFDIVFKESSMFGSNISEIGRMRDQIVDLIQQLYINKKREQVRVVACVDGHECSGPAKIKFEIEEATIDERKSECIQDRQRQCEELVSDLLQMPTSKCIRSTILIEDYVRHLVKDASRAKLVIESLLKWISEPNTYSQLNGSYHTANYLLRTVLEILSNTDEVDTYNSILVDVCFEHPGSVQILSPQLSPSVCSTNCFLDLYKKISSRQSDLGPMSMFVLLSKFDVNSWLKNINNSKELHHEIIKITCSGLKNMGKRPDESFILTFDLYRRHIKIELASPDRRQPREIALILEQFLAFMDEQSLEPSLWSDFMAIIGLEKHLSPQDNRQNNTFFSSSPQTESNSSSISEPLIHSIIPKLDESLARQEIEEITRLSECQKVLDYHSLNSLMQTLSKFINEKYDSTTTNLLELYQDYLKEFGVVMTSVTFMWIKSIGEHYPDNHDLIWKQFMGLWYNMVFFSKNCLREVDKNSYVRIASHFVSAIRFMIIRIPENTQQILRSVLSSLANYVKSTKEVVVYLELSILQGCLKDLPWSSLIMQPDEFENLAVLSEQENYNVSDFVSHILHKVMIMDSLTKIYESESASILPHVVERLATTIVLQSAHLKGFRLHGFFFTLIPVSRIPKIASLILPRMEFANLEQSQTNKLLVNLLRFMCIKLDVGQEPNPPEFHHVTDSFDRSAIYAQFVSNYLVTLLKEHPTVAKHRRTYLEAVMDNSLQDLKILSSPDVDITKKTAIYVNLLECCSSTSIDSDSRLLLAKCVIKSTLLKNRPIVVMEIFHSIGQIITDGRVLVHTIEKMINLYLNMNGYYEKVWKSFCLSSLSSELYLSACITESAPLALLIFFESSTRNSQDHQDNQQQVLEIWSSFFHWISQLSVVTYVAYSSIELKSNDAKLAIAWLRLLDMLEPDLLRFIRQDDMNTSTDEEAITVELETSANDATASEQGDAKQQQATTGSIGGGGAPCISESHRALIGFIKQLIFRYDSFNSGGLWSYIWSTRSDQTSRLSLIALAVACFLADRTLTCLRYSKSAEETTETVGATSSASVFNQARSVPPHLTAFRDDISKLGKASLSKLEAARKSKYYLESAQFIEALIESVKRNDKVQYSEGVQLIATYVKSAYSSEPNSDEFTYISKILPSLS